MRKTVIIITGGPGFGKTSVANGLKEKGYQVGDEFARDLIEEQERIGGDLLPWKNMKSFQQTVLEHRVKFYESVGENEIAFADRAIPDQLAFARYRGFQEPKLLLEKSLEYQYYRSVFITPAWEEIYKKDQIRQETFEEACLIHDYICETYLDLGYHLVELPKVSVDERVQFIINNIPKQDETIKKKIF